MQQLNTYWFKCIVTLNPQYIYRNIQFYIHMFKRFVLGIQQKQIVYESVLNKYYMLKDSLLNLYYREVIFKIQFLLVDQSRVFKGTQSAGILTAQQLMSQTSKGQLSSRGSSSSHGSLDPSHLDLILLDWNWISSHQPRLSILTSGHYSISLQIKNRYKQSSSLA